MIVVYQFAYSTLSAVGFTTPGAGVGVNAGAAVVLFFAIALLLFSLFGMMLFGATDSAWGMRSDITIGGIPLGVVIGALAVVLAAYSLVMDFDSIKRGVESGAPRQFSWSAAFGLIVTLVWLYTEFLRIFALLSGRD